MCCYLLLRCDDVSKQNTNTTQISFKSENYKCNVEMHNSNT